MIPYQLKSHINPYANFKSRTTLVYVILNAKSSSNWEVANMGHVLFLFVIDQAFFCSYNCQVSIFVLFVCFTVS